MDSTRVFPPLFRRWFSLATATALLFVAGVLLQRRLAGELTHSLPPAVLCASAAVVAFLAILSRLSLHRTPLVGACSARLWVEFAISAAVIGFLIALSFPGSPGWLLAVIWVTLLSEELWAHFRSGSGSPIRRFALRGRLESTSGLNREAPAASLFHGDDELPLSAISQRITRADDADGLEIVFGQLRCRFDPGEQHKNLHIAFCPPLATAPQISVETMDGPDASVVVGESQNFGARFELRLHSPPGESCQVGIEFFANQPQQIEQPPFSP